MDSIFDVRSSKYYPQSSIIYRPDMSTSKKVIAVDADEVLAEFMEHFLMFHNLRYETQFTKSEITSFRFEEVFKIEERDVLSRIGEFYEDKVIHEIKPVKGALAGINELLDRGYNLEIITARPPYYKKITIDWVEKHFPKKFKQIHFAFNPFNKNSERLTKAQICKQIGAKVLIDDNLVNALDCAENGITVYLMDAPWNKTEDLPGNVVRVGSWKEIVERLEVKG